MKAFVLARRMTSDTRSQMFQYQLLHRYLHTNVWLWDKCQVDSEACVDCENKKDTIEHMFLHCPPIQKIWQCLIKKFEHIEGQELMYNTTVTLEEYILLGIQNANQIFRRWNWLATYTKLFIYRCRMQKTKPTWAACWAVLRAQLKIRRVVTQQENKSLQLWACWRAWMHD